MTKLTVFRDKCMPGIGAHTTPSEVESTLAFPMPEALTERPEKSDLHFALGLLHDRETGEVSARQYRVNKDGFQRLAEHGLEWRLHWLAVDIDRNSHAPLSPALTDELKRTQLSNEQRAILDACTTSGLGTPYAHWATKGGWRALWPVLQPVRVASSDEYEAAKARIAEIISNLSAAGLDGRDGLQVDPVCKEPNRLYRMANVIREGVATWEQDYMVLSGGVHIFDGSSAIPVSVHPATAITTSQQDQAGRAPRSQRQTEASATLRTCHTSIDEFRSLFDCLPGSMQHRVRRWIEEGHWKGCERLAATREGQRQSGLFRLARDTQRAVNVGVLPPSAMEAVRTSARQSGLPEEEIRHDIERKAREVREEAPDIGFILRRFGSTEIDSHPPGNSIIRPAVEGPEESTLPTDTLPPALLRYAEAVSHTYQVSIELVVVQILALIAASMLRAVRIRITPAWSENVNLWFALLSDTGERKSAVYREVHEPFAAWLSDELDTWKVASRAVRDELAIIDNQIERVRKPSKRDGAGLEGYEPNRAQDVEKLKDLHEQRLKVENKMPPSPDIVIQDATMEAIVERAEHTDGIIYLSNTEGSLFSTVSGRRYGSGNSAPVVDVLLKAKSSESYGYDRRSTNRPEKRIYIPQLDAVALQVVQPPAFRQALEVPFLRDVGFLARWLVVRVPSRVGYRPLVNEPIPPASRTWYRTLIGDLLRRFRVSRAETVELRLSPQAATLFKEDIYTNNEAQMRPDGLLRHAKDIGNRAHATIAQLAAVLHIAEHGPSGVSIELGEPTLQRARRLGQWFLDQTLDTLNPKPDVGSGSVAEFVAANVQHEPGEQLDVRDAYVAYKAWHDAVRSPATPLLSNTGGAFTKELKKALGVRDQRALSKSSGGARKIPEFRLVKVPAPGGAP